MTTIYDVARAAGVNPSSVSYALSGNGTLSQETRTRIIECARELGYRPNQVARSLIRRTTHTVGLLVPDISHPFFAEVAQAADRLAHDEGYRVLVAATLEDDRLGQELLDDLASRRVDGILMLPGGIGIHALQTARDGGVRLRYCFWEEAKIDVPMVAVVDFKEGGRIAAEHLWSLGHRRIGLVTQLEVENRPDHHLRVEGFNEVLAEKGEPLGREYVGMGKSSVDRGKAAALALLDLPERPTAIFATNDLMAIGVLAAAWTRRMRVPQDLSVVGFDDIVTAEYTVPPLTTVRINKAAVVAAALHSLLNESNDVDPDPVRLTPTLVTRSSTQAILG